MRAVDEDRRCQANRLFDAADQPVVSRRGRIASSTANISSSPTAPIPKRSPPWCPEPLEVAEPVVKYEFIRMPDSTGFGDYTETGQVIPVRFKGEEGVYVHSMYLDDEGPIAGGRELWGFPKKLASPKIAVESDVLVGTLHYGSVLCASATMGYKHRPVDHDAVLKANEGAELHAQDHPACRRQPADLRTGALLSRGHHAEGSMDRPAALGLFPHALADVARLPVREVVSALHFKADLTLGLGTVAFDYMAK